MWLFLYIERGRMRCGRELLTQQRRGERGGEEVREREGGAGREREEGGDRVPTSQCMLVQMWRGPMGAVAPL
jgi:hypothetical protein